MMEFISVPAIVGICAWGVYAIFELFARRKERMLLIEKTDFSNAASNKSVDINIGSSGKFGAIRIGFLLAGLGLGLLFAFILGANFEQTGLNGSGLKSRDLLSIVYGACTLLFGGIGLITSFIIEKRYWNK